MLETRVAIITAAGGGMGAAIAKQLHEDGYNVSLMSRSKSCEKLAKQLDGVAVRGSVTEADDLARLVEQTMETYGRIDALVNHTGHPPKGELLEISDEDWHAGLDMLMLNVVRMTRLVTPIMEASGKGAIVNISTFASFEPEPVFPVSCALRAGLAAFTKLYADRYASAGIRMNNLLPGFIDSLKHSDETRDRVPMRRIGSVNEVARTAAFLVSDEAGYITGQNIRVDGGITRHI